MRNHVLLYYGSFISSITLLKVLIGQWTSTHSTDDCYLKLYLFPIVFALFISNIIGAGLSTLSNKLSQLILPGKLLVSMISTGRNTMLTEMGLGYGDSPSNNGTDFHCCYLKLIVSFSLFDLFSFGQFPES